VAKVYLDTRSGRWGVDLRVPPTRTGRRIRFLVGTKREAQAVLAERTTALRQGRFPILKPATAAPLFDDVTRRFLAEHATQRRDLRTFEAQVRLLLRPFGGMTLQQITPDAIRRFMRERLDAGATNGTVNRSRAYLSSILSFAIDAGIWCGPNPCLKGSLGRVKPLREAAPRERFLSPDEAETLLRAAPSPLREILIIALRTGLRRGELLSLRWCDVVDGFIRLRAEICKSGKARLVPIDAVVAEILQRLRPAYAFPEERIFPFSGETLRVLWDRARKATGLGDVRFHDTRRTFGSWASARGASLLLIQRLLGHSSATITAAHYVHTDRAALAEATRFFGPPEAQPTVDGGILVATPLPQDAADRDTMARSRSSGSDESGLQIRWEPGEPGFGGFDSHTLPPILRHRHPGEETP